MALRKELKINYFGFLGFLGFLGFQDPWYFLFFLFFLFFLSPAQNKGSAKIDEFNKARDAKAVENKAKILSLFSQNPKIRNDDVEKSLGVSDATATRYLDELEKEGKIKQVGEGSASYYEAPK